jgi:hypothetical protein
MVDAGMVSTCFQFHSFWHLLHGSKTPKIGDLGQNLGQEAVYLRHNLAP